MRIQAVILASLSLLLLATGCGRVCYNGIFAVPCEERTVATDFDDFVGSGGSVAFGGSARRATAASGAGSGPRAPTTAGDLTGLGSLSTIRHPDAGRGGVPV